MQINAKKLPGVARFPVDQWKEDGRPCLDTAGWYALCRKIAMKDMDNLGGIFDLAETYLEHQFGFSGLHPYWIQWKVPESYLKPI